MALSAILADDRCLLVQCMLADFSEPPAVIRHRRRKSVDQKMAEGTYITSTRDTRELLKVTGAYADGIVDIAHSKYLILGDAWFDDERGNENAADYRQYTFLFARTPNGDANRHALLQSEGLDKLYELLENRWEDVVATRFMPVDRGAPFLTLSCKRVVEVPKRKRVVPHELAALWGVEITRSGGGDGGEKNAI